MLSRFLADDDGLTVIEYVLLASIVALGFLAAFQAIGEDLGEFFEGVSQAFVDGFFPAN